ncbi:MAG: BlaI/MecI/CopY family transcriptional regulator [Pseudomonadota bacterium]
MIRLSDLQLDIMQVLWDAGPATTGDVHQALEASRGLAYTTVATLLKRLEDKGVISRERDGRQYRYTATVAEPEVRRSMVGSLVDQLFRGDPAALVSHLMGDEQVSDKDRARIRQLLDAAENNDGEERT